MSSLLGIYLNDHLMGATAGVELFRRATGARPELAALTQEVEEDRAALLTLMHSVGVREDPLKMAAGWAGEKLGRLKLNGSIISRSPLSDVVELESLTLGVMGKLNGWRLLKGLGDPRFDSAELDRLIARAQRQVEQLDAMRIEAGRLVLGPS